MIKQLKSLKCILLLCFSFCIVVMGCHHEARIGVSFGVGSAQRWLQEKAYMEDYAEAHGIDLEVRLNRGTGIRTQLDDCKEMIDKGVNVLILMPRSANEAEKIIEYARKKNVKVISYARVLFDSNVDLHMGHDNDKIGQEMGKYLIENVYQAKSRYIILQGDPEDNNSKQIHNGAMKKINTVKNEMIILGDEAVIGWSEKNAKNILRDILNKTIEGKSNVVDAIFAPNDAIAGACVEVLEEMGTVNSKGKKSFLITGTDAELSAVRRIAQGKQSMTVFMDLQTLAEKTIEQAVRLGDGKKPVVNTKYVDASGKTVAANLITGIKVTKENLNRVLVFSGIFTWEQVYGDADS